MCAVLPRLTLRTVYAGAHINILMYISDFTYNGHLYLVVNDYLTQNDSQANCVSLGANLASVWSHEENSRLLEVTTEDYCRPNR